MSKSARDAAQVMDEVLERLAADQTPVPMIRDAILAALRQAGCLAEPQPIETAPRDGTEVLLWIPGDEDSPRKGRWEKLLDDPGRPHKWVVGYGWCEDTPTHWMPIPAAPSARPEGEGE